MLQNKEVISICPLCLSYIITNLIYSHSSFVKNCDTAKGNQDFERDLISAKDCIEEITEKITKFRELNNRSEEAITKLDRL
jgi:hypothetical protein